MEDPFVSDLQKNFYALLRVLKPRLMGVCAGDVSGIVYRSALIAKLYSSFIRWKACFAMAGRSRYSCISCWTVMPCTESSTGI